MQVVKPVPMAEIMLISSNLQEPEAVWSSTISYNTGAIVNEGIGVYQSIAQNINTKPSTNPLIWQYIRPSNKWALFDSQITTQSVKSGTIEFTVFTKTMDTFVLFNLIGYKVSIEVRDGSTTGPIIYAATQPLQGDIVLDWYQYFFFDIENVRTLAVFSDIPKIYTNTYTKVILEPAPLAPESNVAIGACLFGKLEFLGDAEFGISSGITDYSKKETDEFGQTTFVKRAYSKRMTARTLVSNVDLNRVQRTLYEIRAVPSLWVASSDPIFEEPLVVYGYYRDFSTDISYATHSYCSLEIEGLI